MRIFTKKELLHIFESLFNALCKIGTFFKFSVSKNYSPNAETRASTKSGTAAATSGDNSPIYIGGTHTHNVNLDKTSDQSGSEIDSTLRFKNRLIAVAHELPHNFRYRGNTQNPFITQALEKLIYDEPMVHSDPVLFQKASHCYNTAKTLSTASPYHPQLKPSDGQYLMKDLYEYISTQYRIKDSSQS